MGDELFGSECRGSRLCGYAFSRTAATDKEEYVEEKEQSSFSIIGDMGCDSGNGSCRQAFVLRARDSAFHPRELQEATERIKAILDPLLQGPDGRSLSFVHTPYGTMLAWVRHGQTFTGPIVTSDSPPEEIAEALGLLDVGDDPSTST